ncbi:hypothetical protein BDR06DRAFT_1013477 [Suillus hirtellus]|nr:hypothetical protein BDR06DRAFT_1013477 [Suillus hirtellus]
MEMEAEGILQATVSSQILPRALLPAIPSSAELSAHVPTDGKHHSTNPTSTAPIFACSVTAPPPTSFAPPSPSLKTPLPPFTPPSPLFAPVLAHTSTPTSAISTLPSPTTTTPSPMPPTPYTNARHTSANTDVARTHSKNVQKCWMEETDGQEPEVEDREETCGQREEARREDEEENDSGFFSGGELLHIWSCCRTAQHHASTFKHGTIHGHTTHDTIHAQTSLRHATFVSASTTNTGTTTRERWCQRNGHANVR